MAANINIASSATKPVNALDHIRAQFNIPPDAPSPISVEACRTPVLVDLYAALGYVRGAEIGVDRGLFAADICQANPGVKLYGVDPWLDYPEYGENYVQDYANGCYLEASARLARYNVELIRAKSMDAVHQFADGSLDFVYIDGNHAYDFVKADITEWSKKVRPGGIVSGHDYCRPRNRARWQFQEVIRAVNEYVAENHIAPWFIFRGRGCSGWLWVKA